MDRVLGDGCGRNDLRDIFTVGHWIKQDLAQKAEILGVQLDVDRGVGVAGHSWGGYLAFMCATWPNGPDAEHPADDVAEPLFTCCVAGAGITDWSVQQRETEVRYYDHALMGGWVYKPEVAARAKRASPKTFADRVRVPLLILHGEDDIDVPFSQIAPFVSAAPSEFVTCKTYPGEGHGISGTAAQKDFLKQLRDFLRIHLKPWDFTDNPHGEVTSY